MLHLGRDAAIDWAFDVIKCMTNEELSVFLNAQFEGDEENVVVVNNIDPLTHLP